MFFFQSQKVNTVTEENSNVSHCALLRTSVFTWPWG